MATKNNTEDQVFVTLNKEQFAELKSIIWKGQSRIDDLEEIGIGGEDDMKCIGFNIGTVYSTMKSCFDQLEEMADSITPVDYDEWANDEDDDSL